MLCVLLLGGVTAAVAANPTPPVVTTGAASSVTMDAATVAGTVAPGGAPTSWRVEYGTSTAYGLTTPSATIAADAATTPVSAPLTKLTSGTTYHYRVTATNAAGVTRGADRTLRTTSPPRAPAVSTGSATRVGRDAATLRGSVDPNAQATTVFFELGPTTAYGRTTPFTAAGSGDRALPFQAAVADLTPGTRYHFRLVASSAAGTVRGADRTFTTSRQPVTVALGASPDPVTYGDTLTIEGRFAGSGVARRAITLQADPFPFTRGFRKIGDAHLTDAGGVVRFTVAPFASATRFRLVGAGVTSAPVTVEVRPRIGLSVRRLKGRRVRLRGTVRPESASGVISIQRRTATGRFVVLRRVALTPHRGGARYGTTIRFRRGLVVRAALRSEGGPLLGATSRVRRVR